MRIVFMGTPDFAEKSLSALISERFRVCGVFTVPDKPRNRGMKLSSSPVKTTALEHGIPVFQPDTLRSGEAMGILRELEPDLIAVVAYGKLLPAEMLAMPRYGCINIHASLLPKLRGSAPVQWAVLSGETVTGVTSMYMSEGMDEGDIIYTTETEIGEFETSGGLFTRLRDMGAELLCKTIADIGSGSVPRTPQDHSLATYTTQLSKNMSPIDWTGTPREIVKHICGLQPWPVATAIIGGAELRVFSAAYTDNKTDAAPGTAISAGISGIEVAAAGGETLLLTEVQASGGKRMSAADYLRGHPIRVGATATKGGNQ